MKVNKMKAYNVILVYSPDMSRILMVKRAKEPYKGLYNCPGGKLETGESNLEGAYRELFEETGISQKDIELKPINNTPNPIMISANLRTADFLQNITTATPANNIIGATFSNLKETSKAVTVVPILEPKITPAA